MDSTALAETIRHFPLLGRPRPSCPSLPKRVHEITDIADAARHDAADQLTNGAHAMNKAALIASDCGLADFARDLCWQHINLYRTAGHPLTVHQARYMLEPVLNLARLQLRASDGDQALRLLTAMFQAITANTDLVVDGHTLPLTNLIGTRAEHHKLREWVWLHLIGDGIRALVLAQRWNDAVAHANAHRGIGLHLMEGRQANIVAHILNGQFDAARAALAESTPLQPWELQVAACLTVMCADPTSGPTRQDVAAMIEQFLQNQPVPGYAAFRAQLGLTVSTLASHTDPDAASHVLTQTADEVIDSGDGYAARDLLQHHDTQTTVTNARCAALIDLLTTAGLGAGTMPETLRDSLINSTRGAVQALRASLS